MAPTKNVETPERHQDEVDHLLFIDPIAKKTTPVIVTEIASECSVPSRYGNNGANPQKTNAVNVLDAAIHGERTA